MDEHNKLQDTITLIAVSIFVAFLVMGLLGCHLMYVYYVLSKDGYRSNDADNAQSSYRRTNALTSGEMKNESHDDAYGNIMNNLFAGDIIGQFRSKTTENLCPINTNHTGNNKSIPIKNSSSAATFSPIQLREEMYKDDNDFDDLDDIVVIDL